MIRTFITHASLDLSFTGDTIFSAIDSTVASSRVSSGISLLKRKLNFHPDHLLVSPTGKDILAYSMSVIAVLSSSTFEIKLDSTLQGSSVKLYSAAWNSAGNIIWLCTRTGEIFQFDLDSRRLLFVTKIPNTTFSSEISWSNNCRRLMHDFTVYDTYSGSTVYTLNKNSLYANWLSSALSPDGRYMYVSYEGRYSINNSGTMAIDIDNGKWLCEEFTNNYPRTNCADAPRRGYAHNGRQYIQTDDLKSELHFGELCSDILLEVKEQNTLAPNPVNVHPNPATEFLRIHRTASHNLSLCLYDMLGNLVRTFGSQVDDQVEFSVRDLNSGMYLLNSSEGWRELVMIVH